MAHFHFDYCLLLNDVDYLYLSYIWTVILVLFDTIATSTNEFDSESLLYPAHNWPKCGTINKTASGICMLFLMSLRHM
jgi:hypothetical protein